MPAVQCVITGCALVVDNNFVWGDLFEVDGVWVFNGAYDKEGPAWRNIRYLAPEDKALVVHSGDHYFERRSVFVVPCTNAHLNKLALQYVAK